jgi:hypothetical protein
VLVNVLEGFVAALGEVLYHYVNFVSFSLTVTNKLLIMLLERDNFICHKLALLVNLTNLGFAAVEAFLHLHQLFLYV